jgi:hypothetical protein
VSLVGRRLAASPSGPRHLATRPRPVAGALRRRPAWALALAGGLLGAGGLLAVGGALPAAGPAVRPAAPPTAPPAPAPGRRSTRACLTAVEQADAVITYLIGDVGDQRLATALQVYVAAARTCRKEAAP